MSAGAILSAGLLSPCVGVPTSLSRTDPSEGQDYLCDEGTAFCLTSLRADCSLYLQAGESIPPQAEERLVLIRPGGERFIKSPDDLVGCISIENQAQALEYLRFFSSWRTVHLFEKQLLEVFPGAKPAYLYGPQSSCRLCLPPHRWRTLGLEPAQVEQTPRGFVVTRYVVRPSPEDLNASDLYRIKQRVGHDGVVELIEQAHVPALSPRERYGLAFPRYL